MLNNLIGLQYMHRVSDKRVAVELCNLSSAVITDDKHVECCYPAHRVSNTAKQVSVKKLSQKRKEKH